MTVLSVLATGAMIKYPIQSKSGDKGLIFGSQFKDTVHHGVEILIIGTLTAGHIASILRNQRMMSADAQFIQNSSQGMAPPWVGLHLN